MSDLDDIIMSSDKAELLEYLGEDLEKANKCVIVVIQDSDEGNKFFSRVMTLGIKTNYEALGILEVGKFDLMKEDRDEQR